MVDGERREERGERRTKLEVEVNTPQRFVNGRWAGVAPSYLAVAAEGNANDEIKASTEFIKQSMTDDVYRYPNEHNSIGFQWTSCF